MSALKPYTLQDLNSDLVPFSLEGVSSIGVACSGGADSLALTILLNQWAQDQGKTLVAFHVDHKLRDTSTHEAQILKSWLESYNISHEILTWNHNGITARIQERAREARYELIAEAARRHSIHHIFLAHHQRDQEETFWMRLSKGSGTNGLASMAPKTQKGEMNYLRPLLNVHPEQLRMYLNSIEQSWIQDPSNTNTKYLRIRLRSLLEEEGYSPEILNKTLSKLREDSDYIETQVTSWISENLSETKHGLQLPYLALKSLHPAMGRRIFQRLIQKIAPKTYSLRNDAVSDLWQKIQNPKFQKATLGNCLIKKSQGKILISKEMRTK